MTRHKKLALERKEREKAQRVQGILTVAKELFFTKGYIQTTMDEIALESGFSKPTLYQYFKTKDDLYFSLLIPVVKDIFQQLGEVKKKLEAEQYQSGAEFIHDLFEYYYLIYQNDPEGFSILQLFQQTGMLWELSEELRSTIMEGGKKNYVAARQIVRVAIKQKLIKKVKIYPFVDVMWGGLFVGIVQLELVKSIRKSRNRYLKSTLELAEKVLIDSVAL